MIIGLDRCLYMLETLVRMYRNTNKLSHRFKLYAIDMENNAFSDVYESICTKNSPIQIYPVDLKPFGYLGFAVCNNSEELLTVFGTGKQIANNTVCSDWACLVDGSNKYLLYNDKTLEMEELSRNLGEDEHFQKMMEMTMPDFADMQKLWKYIDQTKKSIDVHGFSNLVDYKNLDIDISGVEFLPILYEAISCELASVLKISEKCAMQNFIHDLEKESHTSFVRRYYGE